MHHRGAVHEGRSLRGALETAAMGGTNVFQMGMHNNRKRQCPQMCVCISMNGMYPCGILYIHILCFLLVTQCDFGHMHTQTRRHWTSFFIHLPELFSRRFLRSLGGVDEKAPCQYSLNYACWHQFGEGMWLLAHLPLLDLVHLWLVSFQVEHSSCPQSHCSCTFCRGGLDRGVRQAGIPRP
jgi:hypothetical protein